MCGIIATFHYGNNKTTVNEFALEMLENQISRGEEGFGAIFIDNKGKFITKRATEQMKLLVDMNLTPSQNIILHHRMPSSSANKISQTHPIVVENGSLKYGYLVIHNGIIYNATELKEQHEKEGFIYTTDDQPDKRFNDSESLAIAVAKFIEKQTDKVEAKGSCAFIALQYDKKTQTAIQVFYGRNNRNPLKLAKSRDYLYLSSEGKGEEVKADTLYSFNLQDYNIKKRAMNFKEDYITTVATNKIGIQKNIEDYDWDDRTYTSQCHKEPKTEQPNDDKEEVNDKWDMEQLVSECKENISTDLEAIFDAIIDEKTIWKTDIKKTIRYMVATMVAEIELAHQTASEFFAQEIIDEEKAETEKLIEHQQNITEVEKYHSR